MGNKIKTFLNLLEFFFINFENLRYILFNWFLGIIYWDLIPYGKFVNIVNPSYLRI